MKYLKKLIALALCAGMLFALAACGKQNDKNNAGPRAPHRRWSCLPRSGTAIPMPKSFRRRAAIMITVWTAHPAPLISARPTMWNIC